MVRFFPVKLTLRPLRRTLRIRILSDLERIADSIEISTSVPLASRTRTLGGDVFRAARSSFAGRIWRCGDGRKAGWKLRSELFVSLACSDSDACESYRKKYGAVAPTPAQPATLMSSDGQVESDGLGELDSGGGAGGDLILVGARGRGADVGVASAAAARGGEGDEGQEE